MGTTTTFTRDGKVTITKTKSVSGTITIKDGTTTVATVPTSGTFDVSTANSKQVGKQDSTGWTVTVTSDGKTPATVTGSAAGDYGGSNNEVVVPVQVDHDGR